MTATQKATAQSEARASAPQPKAQASPAGANAPDPALRADPQYDLAQAIQLTLDCIRAAANDHHQTSEMREAQRYLFERIMNYYVMMRKRRLSGSIEFLTPHSDGKYGATQSGWYYRGAATPAQARNWIGPYGSPKQAALARDKDAPRTRLAFVEHQLDQMLEDTP